MRVKLTPPTPPVLWRENDLNFRGASVSLNKDKTKNDFSVLMSNLVVLDVLVNRYFQKRDRNFKKMQWQPLMDGLSLVLKHCLFLAITDLFLSSLYSVNISLAIKDFKCNIHHQNFVLK